MVTEGNYTSDGCHRIEYTDFEFKSYTPENYIMLLSNVTLINLIN